MSFDYDFLKDEVREDFYIPGMVKRSWATQLDVLDQIVRICDKYNLKWYAEYGTMIGAARHNGFIPWDDDVDISMFREDYIKFNSVCAKELPEDYVVLNFDTEPEYNNFLTRVTCGNAIDTSGEYLRNHNGFPYVAGVDIFVIDYIYPDEEDENRRKEKASLTYKYADYVASNPNIVSNSAEVEHIIADVYKATGFKINREKPLKNELLKITDHLFSECDGKESEEVALMYFWIRNNSHKYSIDFYKNIVRLPFEDRFMQVPAGFGEILRKNYGDWWRCVRKGGIHEYPFYSEQEKTLEKISSDRLCYRCALDDIKATQLITSKESERNKNKEILDIISKAYNLAQNLISTNQVNEAKALLEQAESIAGNLDNRMLSNEALFVISTEDDINLYMPEMLKIADDTNMYTGVILVPLAKKEADWTNGEYEIPQISDKLSDIFESYKLDVNIYKYDQYDFETIKPKRIYIQIPFDEYSASSSYFPFFYASNLFKHTEELVLVPKFQIANADYEDERLIKNMENIVLSPGFLYSDIIVVCSEMQKQLYLEVIQRKLGYDFFHIFDNKIEVMDAVNSEMGPNVEKTDDIYLNSNKESTNGKKTVLFYTSITDYYRNPIAMERKLKDIFSIFESNNERVDVIWYVDEGFMSNIRTICNEIACNIEALMNLFNEKIGKIRTGKVLEDTFKNEKIDAFYGSPGYVMNRCVSLGIPVMVMDPECR